MFRSSRGLDKGQRQKSMIDLSSAGGHRSPTARAFLGQRSPQERGQGGHRQSMMDLRSGGWRETDSGPNKRYSIAAVGDHIPPHLRQFLVSCKTVIMTHHVTMFRLSLELMVIPTMSQPTWMNSSGSSTR